MAKILGTLPLESPTPYVDSSASIERWSRTSQSNSSGRGGSLTPRSRRVRLGLVSVCCLFWLGIVIARLYSLQISDVERWRSWAERQHTAEFRLASERGPVFDRHGRTLAISVPAGSIFVRPRLVKDKAQTVSALSRALRVERSRIERALASTQPFVWIERQVSRALSDKVEQLKLPGVGYVLESRRMYPFQEVGSTLLGKTSIDGVGLSGIEEAYNRDLQVEQVRTLAAKDAIGNFIELVGNDTSAPELPKGSSLSLTLDAEISSIVAEELERTHHSANARSAMALMLDADTGEILAMQQAPSRNFNNPIQQRSELTNLVVESVFEPGSILKPIVAAAALDAQVVRAQEVLDCENGRFPMGSHVVRDTHPYDHLSFHEVMVRSSNIGMSKVGMRMGAEAVYSGLRRFGFGDTSGLQFTGETRGLLRPTSRWAKIDVATHAFGQGIAVTPLQMARAIAAIANGGSLPALRLQLDAPLQASKRIISERSARAVQEMMYDVVASEHGTGGKAAIPGVRVGGKTGTAQKARVDGRGYEAGAYIASFVGFADASSLGLNQRLVLLVVVDEPRGKSYYGGAVAAPAFQRILQRTLSLLLTRSRLQPRSMPPAGHLLEVGYRPA